jgi:hypothetical protein
MEPIMDKTLTKQSEEIRALSSTEIDCIAGGQLVSPSHVSGQSMNQVQQPNPVHSPAAAAPYMNFNWLYPPR